MSVAAQYPGTCPVCEGRIEVGELIVNLGNQLWTHLDCEDTPPANKATETCPRCWQQLAASGACGCDP